MRQTQQDLELLERQRKYYETQRYGYETQFNEQTAENLSKAVHGSYYTNPEITAAIGLSGVPVDPREIHINTRSQMTRDAQAPRNGSYVRSTPDKLDPEDAPTPFTLVDLLRIPDQDRMRYRSNPRWWDEVDPGGRWRNLPVPTEIKDARELLNLQEAQVAKLFMSKTEEEWLAIPGMVAQNTYDSKGNRIPGSFDAYADLSAKFPKLGQMWTARSMMSAGPEPWSVESISKNVLSAFQEATTRAIQVAQLPFKVLGFFAPDHIGPAGGVQVAGVDLPSRISLKGLGDIARGTIRGALVPLMAAGQASKSSIEQMLSQSGGLSGLDLTLTSNPAGQLVQYARIFSDDEKRKNFVTSVVEGNILSQIANQALTEGRIDLGSGYFPEGTVAQRAREKHDAGLPKIEGRTWTFGNAAIEPLIQEEWIDRDGYAATVFSGILDGVFTVGTDISAYADPVKGLMNKFNLGTTAATAVIKGRAADLVYDAWAAERRAAGLSTTPLEIIDLPGYALRAEGEEIPRFAGMLPEGTVLPDEAEAAAQAAAKEVIDNSRALVAMDSPPPVLWDPNPNITRRQRLGVIDRDDAPPLIEPMAIDAMPFTTDGRLTLNKLSSFANAGEMWDYFLGEIPPGLVQRIQDTVDAARAAGQEVNLSDIHAILKEGVLSGDPYYNIRQVPGIMRQWTQQTGKKIASYAQDKTRQFAMMPNVTFFSFGDPLTSIRDMNRIMVLMKVGKEERHAMLSSAIRAVANGQVDKRFALQRQWMDTVLRPSLSKNGVPAEWIDEIAKWEGWTDEIHQWTVDAVGRGYPAVWFTDETADVIRTTDMIPKGFMMINPDNLRQAIRETTNLWKAFSQFRGNPKMEKALRADMFEWMRKLQNQWMKPAALGAPLPIRMVTRILPDELLRVAVSEGLDETSLKALGAMGHVNYNTFGVELKTAKEIQKLVPIVEELDYLYNARNIARRANNVDEVDRLTRLIDDLEATQGTKAQLQMQIETFNERINTALPGSGRNVTQLAQGLMGQELGTPSVVNYVQQNRRTQAMDFTVDAVTGARIIDPTKPANKNWVVGTARDIVQMSETPEYREVARAMLAGGQDAVLELPNRFLNGDLRQTFDNIYERILRNQGIDAMDPVNPITSMQGNAAWVYTIYNDILTRTAGDRVAIGAIVTGKLGDAAISKLDAWKIKTSRTVNVYEASEEWVNWVRDNLLTNPNSPEVAPFAATVGIEEVLKKDRLFTKLFSIYRDASAKYSRGPYKDYHKWKRIREMIPGMDPTEARLMVEALDQSDAPEWLRNSLREELPRANGTATRKQVELLGEMHGNQMVDNLLYNSENNSYFGYRHSLLFGFFDAWKEQWSVWGRQMATSPTSMERARLAGEGLKGIQLPSIAAGQSTANLMYKDEDTGEYVFALPFSRQFYEMIGLNGEERIRTRNLTLLGSAVPGFFGFGAVTMDSVIPKTAAFDWMRRVGFPYGDPEARSKLADYFAAPWLQSVVGGTAGLVGEQRSTDIVKNIQNLMSTDTNDNLLASLTNAVWANQAQKYNGIPMTAQERERFLEDSVTKASLVAVFVKGLSKVFLPGASYTKYFQEVGNGEFITSGQMMDELRTFTNQAIEEGKSYGEGVSKFLDKYGDSAWVYLAGSTRALPGMQASKEYYQWELSNGELLDKYPLVAGYMGPQDGEYDPKAYTSQRARGYRSPKEIATRQQEALEDVAWSVYNNTAATLIANGERQGFTEEQIRKSEDFQARMKIQSDALKKSYPTWDPRVSSGLREQTWNNQEQQIMTMITDEKVLALPAGQALKEYWDYRTRNIDKAVAINPELANESWRTSRAGAGLRAKLVEQGEYLVEQYPEFATLWERVLSREYD